MLQEMSPVTKGTSDGWRLPTWLCRTIFIARVVGLVPNVQYYPLNLSIFCVLWCSNEEFEDRKLRNQLRNASRVEAEVAAIKIANLKKLGRGSKVILLDS
jgi:hypothetical protein